MREACRTTCPHCGATLAPVALPEVVCDHGHDLVCFDDACPYYVRGWAWMDRQYGVKASYRYRVDPTTGFASPLAVWSPTALRGSILAAAGAAHAAGEDRP